MFYKFNKTFFLRQILVKVTVSGRDCEYVCTNTNTLY